MTHHRFMQLFARWHIWSGRLVGMRPFRRRKARRKAMAMSQ